MNYEDNTRTQDLLVQWASENLSEGDADWTIVETMIELLQETLPVQEPKSA